MLATDHSEYGAVAPAIRREDPTVSIHYIKRHTGTDRLKDRALLSYVEALIADHGFPQPLPCPVKGQGATTAVRIDSRWRRDAVDLWLDDRLPPATAASLDERAAAEAGELMDKRAAQLGLRVVDGGAARWAPDSTPRSTLPAWPPARSSSASSASMRSTPSASCGVGGYERRYSQRRA